MRWICKGIFAKYLFGKHLKCSRLAVTAVKFNGRIGTANILVQREVTRSGQVLRLTTQEFALLEFLSRNAGRVVTRAMILERVWGMRIEPKTNVVDVHMSRLRVKVDGEGRKPLIETLRGKGYVLRDL